VTFTRQYCLQPGPEGKSSLGGTVIFLMISTKDGEKGKKWSAGSEEVIEGRP